MNERRALAQGARRVLCLTAMLGLGVFLQAAQPAKDTDVLPGPVITLLTPSEGSATHLSLPFFKWQDAVEYPCPGEYEIQIARDSEFADLVDSDKVPALANYYVPAIELSANSYYWRVRHLNEAGLVAHWSEVSSFQVRALEGDDVVHVSAGASWEEITAAYGEALDRASRKPSGVSGVELRFENAVYNLRQPAEGQALFETPAGMGGVVIDGRGATFILKARTSGTGRHWQVCGFLYADGPDTSAIQVRNCIVDYHPESQRTVAARIVGLDRKAGTFTAELLPKYAAALPQIGHVKAGVFLAGETFQRSLAGTRAHTEQDWPAARDATTGLFHFTINRSALSGVDPGDYWVSYLYGGGDLFGIGGEVEDLVVNNNTFYSVRNRIGNVGQRARFVGNGFLRKDGRVWCITKGGFGTVATRHTWLEDNVIQGTRDDMYHLLHGYGVIRNNRLEGAYRNSIHVHGERVWVEGNTIMHGGSGGIQIGGKGISTAKLGDSETRLTSTEYRGMHGLIIRNNTIISPWEQGIHTRRPPSDVFAEVRFKGIVEPQYEGFEFTDILIEGNKIVDAGRNQAIYVHGKDIQIRDNSISNKSSAAFGAGSFPETEIGIHVDRCRDVVVDGNRVADPRLRPGRDVVVRQSPNTTLNGRLFRDEPKRVLDYLNLPTGNLACRYRLDETGGPTAFDSVRRLSSPVQGTWAPREGVSGRPLGRQVYCMETASWKPPEPSGAALRLNGRDDVLETECRDMLPDEINQLSVSLFFNAGDSMARAPQVLWEIQARDPVAGALRLVRVARELRVEARCGATTVSLAVPFYYDKYWQHAAVIFDQGRLQLFLNGYLVMEETGNCPTLPPAHSMRVGAGYGPTGARASHFNGMVDDVRVYRGAITQAADASESTGRFRAGRSSQHPVLSRRPQPPTTIALPSIHFARNPLVFNEITNSCNGLSTRTASREDSWTWPTNCD